MRYFIVIFLLLYNTVIAANLHLKSGQNRVNIIELYTSEGCSSCPRADKWLSSLKNNDEVFKKFIPMAFHVTYWDFIGWKDTFGEVKHDNRQRYYSSNIWNKNAVYTPQFIINAKEYRRWFSFQGMPSFKKQYGGNLEVQIRDKQIKTSFYSKKIHSQEVKVNTIILGFDYAIEIKSGENDDKTLEHDFVVLKHIEQDSKIIGNKLTLKTAFPFIKKDKHSKAITVWVSDKNGQIIQAVGGYLIN